jgi:hypothetical protein
MGKWGEGSKGLVCGADSARQGRVMRRRRVAGQAFVNPFVCGAGKRREREREREKERERDSYAGEE